MGKTQNSVFLFGMINNSAGTFDKIIQQRRSYRYLNTQYVASGAFFIKVFCPVNKIQPLQLLGIECNTKINAFSGKAVLLHFFSDRKAAAIHIIQSNDKIYWFSF